MRITCHVCKKEPKKCSCSRGTRGLRGPQGPRGLRGLRGPAGTMSSAFGYIFNTGLQTINPNNDVIFSNNGVLQGGIIHGPNTAQITVTQGGIYLIAYNVSIQGPSAAAYGLAVNGAVAAPNTQYGTVLAAGNQVPIVGVQILEIPPNAIITLRNVGITADILPTTADGATIVNAAIRITRIQ